MATKKATKKAELPKKPLAAAYKNDSLENLVNNLRALAVRMREDVDATGDVFRTHPHHFTYMENDIARCREILDVLEHRWCEHQERLAQKLRGGS